jgi:hypothetical protein
MLCLSGLRARQGLKGTVSHDKLRRLPACLPSKAAPACSACLDYVPDRYFKGTVSQDELRRLPACLPSKAGRAYTAFLFYLLENRQEFKASETQDKLRRLPAWPRKLGTSEFGTVTVTKNRIV